MAVQRRRQGYVWKGDTLTLTKRPPMLCVMKTRGRWPTPAACSWPMTRSTVASRGKLSPCKDHEPCGVCRMVQMLGACACGRRALSSRGMYA